VLSRCNPPDAIIRTVKTGRTPIQPTLRVLLPRPTVRWRLTLLYSLIFLSCGAALLAITYWLFANFAYSPPKEPNNPIMVQLETAMSVVRSNGLHRLQLYSGIALAIMAVASVVLGWLVAGRVLAPLRTITATADRISDTNLHERLAMSGPRDELRLLADTIDRLLARLEAAFDAQRRFVANASHELRTPLAMMRTTLDVAIAKPGGVPAQTRELDAELRVDLDHADQLLESFLTLARGQNGQLEERDQVALEPLIRSGLSDRADQIAAKELTVETDLDTVAVAGSPTLLRRMIENVIENAVRHTNPGGLVEIALTSCDGRQARVVIASSGAVLDPDEVAQLTQPFKRLSQDRTGSQDGHGLGLSIVAAVAAAHGGKLDLNAPAEGGLRVHITLPAVSLPHLAQAIQ
jgi:signal transduction histidine kinase